MAPRTTLNISQVSDVSFPSVSLIRADFISSFLSLGGGDVKIESHKLNIKAKSKVGSLDNMGPGNGQTDGHKVKLKDTNS